MSNSNPNPRILIAGCGYTGEKCADFFYAAKSEVIGLVSSQASAERLASKPFSIIAADAADKHQLCALKERIGAIDLLVHCLSGRGPRDAANYRTTYIATLQNLLEVFAPAFSVFTSSTSVYPQNDASSVDETSTAGGTPTADVLLEAEQIVLRSGGASVRLGGIYGPGRTRFVDAVLNGQPLAMGEPHAIINFIHRDDAAQALYLIASRRLPGIFNAVDDTPIRRDILANAILESQSLPAHPLSADSSTGKRVQNQKLRATGWTPQFSSALDAVISSLKAQN